MTNRNILTGQHTKNVWILLLILILLLTNNHSRAHIRLPQVLASHMVLQQRSAVAFWGWADPGEKVYITPSWNGKKDSVVTDGNGKWKLMVQTPDAGGPFTVLLKGNNKILLENIMVGEVWICSGQSNMEMNYFWGLPQMKEDFKEASNSNIRFFHIPKSTASHPQERSEGSWAVSDSFNVKSFSAVAWYFGKRLEKELGVPIGLIHASWGGTPAEAWTPAPVVESVQDLKEAAKRLGSSNHWPVQPGLAYNAMIAPLTSFVIGGAIWYQGESNTGTAATYQGLFSSMILSWREQWKKDFPFLFVQLAPYNYGKQYEGALLREAQEKTLTVPKTAMVVTTDIGGDTTDIHPRNKREVGYRLAGLALSDVYGKKMDSKSITFREMTRQGQKIILRFTPGHRVVQKGSNILGFHLAGSDQVFHEAIAKLVGNEIHVWHDEIREPVAVRYAFSNTAVGNVAGQNGLPLAPFRTDNWKVETSPVIKTGNWQPVKKHGALSVRGTQLTGSHGENVMLRGMSFGWHNFWPRFYNAEAVKWLVDDWKINVVRAAMGIEPDRGYLKDKAGSKKMIRAVVDAAIEKNIYVIIDWHSHSINMEEAKEFFKEMATAYGNYPHVIYEIFNEPDYETWEEVKKYSEEVIKTIRAIDPDNIILVGSPHWDQDVHVVADDPLKDQSNIMYTLHFYAATHKEELRKRADYALSKGLPLFISESAGMEASGNGPLNVEEWENWIDWAEKNNISWITWSVSDKDETCSVLQKSAASTGGWNESDLKESGILIRNYLRKFNKN